MELIDFLGTKNTFIVDNPKKQGTVFYSAINKNLFFVELLQKISLTRHYSQWFSNQYLSNEYPLFT
ncbi:MAG: hypothetical protein EAZ70_12690 [Runella slithyformis]|nr:MAG: hypothetical protein EAY79_12965 [Runella slithyformis]TAF93116.1 MAG: hypothetical protein EAZ46_12775 [Runella sp.]TAG23677.1 MAG: hypothetical protein EAZ38_02950 [Cytophagales bacterium]TAG42897.1 MAG: hypothetical protein EAZ32_00520 [Cytophagia bacterium]TAF23723.1 MAG: hypothetical protein EAZ70_12690 [Runella slithyformis]